MNANMSIWSHTEFYLQFADPLRVRFDPGNDELVIYFSGGSVLSDTTISGTNRTG
jgi:hypothetical protein